MDRPEHDVKLLTPDYEKIMTQTPFDMMSDQWMDQLG